MCKIRQCFLLIFLTVVALGSFLGNVVLYLNSAGLEDVANLYRMESVSEIEGYFEGKRIKHLSNFDFAGANDPVALDFDREEYEVRAYQLSGVPVRVAIVYVQKESNEIIRRTWVEL